MAQAQSAGATVINAVLATIENEARRWQSNTKMAGSHLEQARDLQDEADAGRARWEQCKAWLDYNVPGWLNGIPEDARWKYELAISQDEEVHAST